MIEKSSTRMPSSGIVVVPSCIDRLLSRQPKAALCNQTALNFIGPDTDDPHQGMTEVLLKSAVVEGTRHLLGQCRAHPKNVERGLAEALHQFAGEHLADCAVFRWRDLVGR